MQSPAGENSTTQCIWCKLVVSRSKHMVVLLPECHHVYHLDCLLKALLIHNIKGCIECSPDTTKGTLDLGDDIRLREIINGEIVTAEVKYAKDMQMSRYKTSVMVDHANQITQLDASIDTRSQPLECWIPGFDKSETVRIMFEKHASPTQLRRAGITPVIMLNSGFTVTDLFDYKYTIKEVKQMGFDWTGLIAMGLRLDHLKRATDFPIADLVRLFNVTYVHILKLEGEIRGEKNAILLFCNMLFKRSEFIDMQMTDIELLVPYGLDRDCMYGLGNSLDFKDLVALKMTGNFVRKIGMLREVDFEKMGWPSDHHLICKTLSVSPLEVKKKPVEKKVLVPPLDPASSRRMPKIVEDMDENPYPEPIISMRPIDVSQHEMSPIASLITKRSRRNNNG